MTWHSFRTDPPDARWPVIVRHPQWERDELLVGLKSKVCASTLDLVWAHTGISRVMAGMEEI